MEKWSRRVLQALVVGAVGPATATAALYLLTPVALGWTLESRSLGGVLAAFLLALLVLLPVVAVLALAAVALALRWTRCPAPGLAVLTSVLAVFAGYALLEAARSAGLPVDGLAWDLVPVGAGPALVRIGFDVLLRPPGPAPAGAGRSSSPHAAG